MSEPRSTSPAAPTTAVGPRLPTIDVLRGVAILLVILYHLNNLIILPGGWGLGRGADGSAHLPAGSLVMRFIFLPFHLGRVGVNLFFVLSGLCIHMRWARVQASGSVEPFSLREFFLRRFFRIYPTYWAALGIGVFIVPFLYSAVFPAGAPEVVGMPAVRDVLFHAVMLHSFVKQYMMSIIRSLWSIATEEQFYLLYPLVFVLLGRRVPIARLVVGLLAFTVVWRLAFVLANPPPPTFYDGPFLVWIFGFSLPRYYEWSLGALLAWMLANRNAARAPFAGRLAEILRTRPRTCAALGLGLILAGAGSLLRVQTKYLMEDPCYSTGWFLIVGATLLQDRLGGALPPGARARAWVLARLQSLGRRSFSVYLLHEIALFVTAGLMRTFHLPPITVAAPLGCLLVWALCYPFYKYVEAPFELRSKRVGKPVRTLAPAVAAAAAPRD
jgi:peptidoglycan/LPS O-acetylase OafA/YrhL